MVQRLWYFVVDSMLNRCSPGAQFSPAVSRSIPSLGQMGIKMKTLHGIRNYPIVVLTVMSAALFTWIFLESSKKNNPDTGKPIPESRLKKPEFQPKEPPRLQAQVRPTTVELLSRVKPGMPRVEVERLIGLPEPEQIQAVTETNGRLTYRTAYELEEAKLPMTIRPTQQKSTRTPKNTIESKSQLTFEYDATKPGHPLIEVHFPDC